MKVTLINTFHFSGGAAVACYRLMQALRKNNTEASMLVQEQNFPDEHVTAIAQSYIQQKKALLRFAADRFYFLFHEKNKQVRFAFSPANIGMDISQHPLVQEADILHLHWINFGFLSIHSLQKLIETGKPMVWTLHDMWAFTGGCHYSGDCRNFLTHCHTCPFLKSPHSKDLSYQVFEKKLALLSKANIIFVPCSQWLADLAKQSNLLSSFKIQSIPNPIDTEVYKPLDKQVAQQSLGLLPGKKYILFGAFKITDKRKGFTYLQEALQILQTNHPDTINETALLIFGKTGKDEPWQNLSFPVYNLGKISATEQLVKVYNAAHVFVLPSLEDNLPNTVMESLACGTPVVAFNTGGIPEMIEHLQNGYLAHYRSSVDLAEGIYQVLSGLAYNEFCNTARQKVLKAYTEEVVATKYRQLYESLLA